MCTCTMIYICMCICIYIYTYHGQGQKRWDVQYPLWCMGCRVHPVFGWWIGNPTMDDVNPQLLWVASTPKLIIQLEVYTKLLMYMQFPMIFSRTCHTLANRLRLWVFFQSSLFVLPRAPAYVQATGGVDKILCIDCRDHLSYVESPRNQWRF